MPDVHAIILAGGSGTRFWPASRRSLPKQFLSVAPGANESLIAATVRRIAPLAPTSRVVVATGTHLLEQTRRALPELPAQALLGEPLARNTAACIGWATSIVLRDNPDALIMTLHSDHFIADEAAFLRTLERALASANEGVITTIGITPTRPETGYGYIELGEAIEGISASDGERAKLPDLHRVERFVEKPKLETAKEYLASGRFLWNSGMFFFKGSVMLNAIERHLPALHAGLERIQRAHAQGSEAEANETRAVFESLPSVSIDVGVLEKAERLNVVTGDFGWYDVGSWESAWELSPRDAEGNAADGRPVLIDARGNLVRDLRTSGGDKRVIALVGVENLCVIETDDALLVIPRERAQDAKLVVEALNQRGDSRLT